MCRIHGIVYETMMEDEENQVRGYVHFSDGAGVSFPHLTLFTPKEAVRIVKNGEVNYLHHLYCPALYLGVLDFYKFMKLCLAIAKFLFNFKTSTIF